MTHFKTHCLLILILVLLFTACAPGNPDNSLTDTEKKEGWTLLFDGKSAAGWHIYNRGAVPSAWEVKDGIISCNRSSKLVHGDLVTNDEYENFELTFDFKIPSSGNSGVFINVKEKSDLPYAWASGPEYQLLEKTHPDYVKEDKRSGCLYGFAPQKNAAETKSGEEWNHSKIRQLNGKIEFYLNGIKTAEEDFTAPSWKDKISRSGFKTFPEFGIYTKGHIALQEWTKGISFKNIKIKPL